MAVPEITQTWFEMAVLRNRSYNSGTVWIPLRSSEDIEEGESGEDGYVSEYFGLGSIAISISTYDEPVSEKKESVASKVLNFFRKRSDRPKPRRVSGDDLGWHDIGINHSHSSHIRDDGTYVRSDEYDNGFQTIGLHLIIDQFVEGDGYREWHIHHDLVVALGLKREGDTWVDPRRGYIEAIRLRKNAEGKPCYVEIRANYLKDYLAARKLRLRVAYYRQRMAILPNRDCVDWDKSPVENSTDSSRWEGRIDEIHEGGLQYGSSMAVFHAGRTGVDDEADVPEFKMGDGITTKTWTKTFDGKRLYRIQGELWREEWVEPAATSQIVSGDEPPPTTQFIVNEKGDKENGQTLVHGVRWLWFRPEVVPALLGYRGSGLVWYTRFTGSVQCSPSYAVHFGINDLGFVNVFAKDIGQLPEWQQQIWVAYNVGPEGGVSSELMDSQSRAEPADTQPPEKFLARTLDRLDEVFLDKFGFKIFQEHSYVEELIPKVHRFRSLNEDGLRALAKDLARLVADRIDALAIQKIVKPPKGEKWAGLKSLENLLAARVNAKALEMAMRPLYGIYYLRVSDAHLPLDVERAKAAAMLDTTKPYVYQGFNIISVCVESLTAIAMMVEKRF